VERISPSPGHASSTMSHEPTPTFEGSVEPALDRTEHRELLSPAPSPVRSVPFVSRKSLSRVVVAVTLGTALGLGGVAVVEPRLPTSPTVVGLRVDGEPIAVGSDLRGLVERRAATIASREIVLVSGGDRFDFTLAELGIRVDVEATVADALAVGHQGSVVKRLSETATARRGAIDVSLVVEVDEDRLRDRLAAIAPELVRKPVDAHLDLANRTKIPDVSGRALDVDRSLRAIVEQWSASAAIRLETRDTPATVTVADLADLDVEKVLAKQETRFSPWEKGRSINVALAASKIDGLVLRPHQVMSFNDHVGPRTVEAGFQQAPEIVGDELTVGIGGGTCQVSSTLHVAALYGGLEIVERKSHSRPSSYTVLGLDATVAYPKVDLKVKNPYSFPVVIHAHVPEPGILRVEVLGGEAVESVHYVYGVSRIENYVRRITVKPWMKNRAFRKQKGTRGMDVSSVVTIKYLDGRVEKRQYYSGYRATPEVFWVSPDYDEAELPILPDHAKGVEGRLDAGDGSDIYPG
jgi:vancomycin resistance protein YoaR